VESSGTGLMEEGKMENGPEHNTFHVPTYSIFINMVYSSHFTSYDIAQFTLAVW
jgi:hypothetical protein